MLFEKDLLQVKWMTLTLLGKRLPRPFRSTDVKLWICWKPWLTSVLTNLFSKHFSEGIDAMQLPSRMEDVADETKTREKEKRQPTEEEIEKKRIKQEVWLPLWILYVCQIFLFDSFTCAPTRRQRKKRSLRQTSKRWAPGYMSICFRNPTIWFSNIDAKGPNVVHEDADCSIRYSRCPGHGGTFLSCILIVDAYFDTSGCLVLSACRALSKTWRNGTSGPRKSVTSYLVAYQVITSMDFQHSFIHIYIACDDFSTYCFQLFVNDQGWKKWFFKEPPLKKWKLQKKSKHPISRLAIKYTFTINRADTCSRHRKPLKGGLWPSRYCWSCCQEPPFPYSP